MMNGKSMTVVATMALAAALALVGCGGSQPTSSSATAGTAASAASSASAADNQATTSAEESSTAAEETSTAAEPATAQESTAAAQGFAETGADYIGEQAAIAAALADAGLTEADATEIQAELDLDDATVHYEVDFKANGMEYDYDIDATTGDILSAESEIDD